MGAALVKRLEKMGATALVIGDVPNAGELAARIEVILRRSYLHEVVSR